MTVLERFKRESVYGLSTTKSGRCRMVAVTGGSTVRLIFVLKADTTYFQRKKIYSHSCTVRPTFFTVCLQKNCWLDASGFGTFILYVGTVPPPKWSPPSKWSPPPKWPPITTEMIPGNRIKRTTKTRQQFSACFLFIYITSFIRCVIYLLPHFILQ